MPSDVDLRRISRVDARNSHTDRAVVQCAPESISKIAVFVTIIVAISRYVVVRMALSPLILAIS